MKTKDLTHNLRKKGKRWLALILAVAMIGSLTACTTASASSGSEGETAAAAAAVTQTAAVSETLNGSELFTERDLNQTPDLSEAVYETIQDGQVLTITEEGIYVISGTASEAQIVVEAADEAKVQLVLDGVEITNSSTPCIYVKNADKVFVTTTDSENTLTVTGTFTAEGDTNTDGVIFAKDDLVLNGVGTLVIGSTANGVVAKDDLKITGGTYEITAAADAFEANDSIAVADGTFTLKTGKDGFQVKNNEDAEKGYVYIGGGTFDIQSGNDGIQAKTVLQVDGGTLNIQASEALESTLVEINDGTITIVSGDDGINATQKSTAYSPKIEINGGNISITMGQGDTDALDSNGDLIINGGTIDINAQFAFDFDGQGELNGGTVTVNGETVTEITNSMMGGGFGGGQGGPRGEGENGFGGKMQRPDGDGNGQDSFTPPGTSGEERTDGNTMKRPKGERPENADGTRPERPSGGKGHPEGRNSENSQSADLNS